MQRVCDESYETSDLWPNWNRTRSRRESSTQPKNWNMMFDLESCQTKAGPLVRHRVIGCRRCFSCSGSYCMNLEFLLPVLSTLNQGALASQVMDPGKIHNSPTDSHRSLRRVLTPFMGHLPHTACQSLLFQFCCHKECRLLAVQTRGMDREEWRC